MLLSTMLVPSLRKTMHSSYGMVCFNNYKSHFSAISLYSDDYAHYPSYRKAHHRSTTPTGWYTIFWDDLLGAGYDGRNLDQEDRSQGYLRPEQLAGAEIYRCPLDAGGPRDIRPSSPKWLENKQANGTPRSYSLNGSESGANVEDHNKKGIAGSFYGIFGAQPWHTLAWSRHVADVTAPKEFLLMVESPGEGMIGGGGAAITGAPEWQIRKAFFDKWLKPSGLEEQDYPTPYHHNGWNYLFVDGHVENLLPNDTKGKFYNNRPRGYWTDNPDD